MTQFDPDWLDHQYNNRARIPEHPLIFERWERASALAREGLSPDIDVAYGKGRSETLDVFAPETPGAPVLVFIHGGWWRALDKRDLSFIAPSFVRAGAMVVIPNYALCPAISIEGIALQMARALAWTWRNAVHYGGDPQRIVVAGHSAGAHLAAMLMCCDWRSMGRQLPARLVDRGLAISGVYDLEPLRQTPFLQADLRLTPQAVERLSPAYFPAPGGTLYAVVGGHESEEFLRQNDLIRDTWGPKTVPVCETIDGAHHLNVLHELVDPEAHLHALAIDLLELPRRRR
jgi:arylformamidase